MSKALLLVVGSQVHCSGLEYKAVLLEAWIQLSDKPVPGIHTMTVGGRQMLDDQTASIWMDYGDVVETENEKEVISISREYCPQLFPVLSLLASCQKLNVFALLHPPWHIRQTETSEIMTWTKTHLFNVKDFVIVTR